MSPAGCGALLFLWLLQSAGVRPYLAPPQNVTLLSWNFSVYLTWLPGPGNPQNVTYLVAYQSLEVNPQQWRKVKKCVGTKELTCSLMCLEKQDLHKQVQGTCAGGFSSSRSPWVESKYLNYLFEVEPAPPILVVTLSEEILKVNATYQLPPCMPLSTLDYEVEFWKAGTGNKTRFPVTRHGQEVQIPLRLAASGNHCVSARTIYTLEDPKYSEFSKPICFSLEAPGVIWALLVLLPLLLVIPMGWMIWKSFVVWKRFIGNPWFQQAEMPQALDFSGHTHPVATFQPCDPEFLDDLTLCPQKELTRKIRPASSVRAPAIIQAGSEDNAKEDDDEDTDDNVSFQPYVAHPHFLEQEHQTLGKSEGGTQVGSCPAWDSSGGSWASTVSSSALDKAGSSGYLTGVGPGQGLGGDRCQDPLILPKFSKDLGSLEELQRDDLSSCTSWDSSSPKLNLVPGEPLISFQTLTFCWGSSAEEEEEGEEEEDGGDSEIEDSSADSWGAGSLQRTDARSRTLGHYLAR